MPQLTGAVVLVTGANGGLGREFVEQALARGAAKVYATARRPQEWHDSRIVPLALDVTDPASIRAVLEQAPDVTVLVNNAGIALETDTLLSLPDKEIRKVMETNFFGPVALTKAFAPVLALSPTSAVLNIHSVLSWIALTGAYSASKAALWSATNAFRIELAPQGTHVTGVHVAYIDTAMAEGVSAPKTAAEEVVRKAFDGLEQGDHEVIVDDITAGVKFGLSGSIPDLYPALAANAPS
ncbi:NAD(P)-dependent dehydrogenase (short-subunit alcohol dehydrogenase family) [Paenarthrobacter nitroguajacolicus]|uniref:SDR family oxidoreductase n=1 Tax=Paenarthrobacter nitroguajacolicus TaxID=211146 RepID=UPI002866E88F|nr:SDR family oxidoreductase [Paenarthrobacter nitroguajacolicus]MDR6987542.1 NAD(P)-dependent dehydrogenase (short-subunit alcohol dehydrogenase family) [Paenarthrobacter nitroguajacolicus]